MLSGVFYVEGTMSALFISQTHRKKGESEQTIFYARTNNNSGVSVCDVNVDSVI